MKRKLFSILLTVAFVTGLILIPAAPAAAVAADAIPKATFTTNASGTAEWSTTQKDAGDYSVEFTLTVTTTDHAVVQVFLPAGITLADLADMSYKYYVDSTGSDIVNQGGIATKDGWSDSVPVYQAPYLSIQFSVGEVAGGIVQHDVAVITSINTWGTDTIGGDEVWHGTFGDGNKTFAEFIVLYGDETVTSVCLQLDKNGTDDTVTAHSYVDDITINEVTYAMEPRVINTDTLEGFNTITLAIDDGNTVDTNTITVAEGTYVGNLIIDKDLTIAGTGTPTIDGDVHFASEPIIITDVALGTDFEWYVDSNAAKIQDAIDAASAGDIINVATGTYAEDLEIPAGTDNLELSGASGATIKGVDIGAPGAFENFDIMIKASGAKIHGFTIQGPDPVGDKRTGGMVIGRPDAEIYDNAFEGTNATLNADISQVIQTWDETMDVELIGISVVDVDGLSIHNNTFTGHGTGTLGYEGIYINTDGNPGEDTNTISIADNTFTGEVWRGITVERSYATISGNTIITDWIPGITWGSGVGRSWTGININDAQGEAQTTVTVSGNTIKGSSAGKGFLEGIRIGRNNQDMTLISVTQNTVQMNTRGIMIWGANADADAVVINYNDISGNVTYGVLNEDTSGTLDARYNWWGAAAGPDDDGTKNPYNAQAATAGADKADLLVDFIPWLMHTDLVSGWNVYSTPITSGISTDTINEALDIFGTSESSNFDIAYYFDSSATPPAFAEATSLTPLQAVYLKMDAASTIDVLMSPDYTAPPSRIMYAGWNLIGLAELYTTPAEDALASAYYVAGDNNIGYSIVTSPGLGQTAWNAVRGETINTASDESMLPLEGYWVYMVNQGTLAGFTSTPITLLP